MLSFKSKMVDCNETASSLCFYCSYRGSHKHLKVAHVNELCAFFFLAHSVTYNIDNWLRLFKVDFFFILVVFKQIFLCLFATRSQSFIQTCQMGSGKLKVNFVIPL